MEKAGQDNTPDPETPWELNDEKLLERWHLLGARKMYIEQQIIDNRLRLLRVFSLGFRGKNLVAKMKYLFIFASRL